MILDMLPPFALFEPSPAPTAAPLCSGLGPRALVVPILSEFLESIRKDLIVIRRLSRQFYDLHSASVIPGHIERPRLDLDHVGKTAQLPEAIADDLPDLAEVIVVKAVTYEQRFEMSRFARKVATNGYRSRNPS